MIEKTINCKFCGKPVTGFFIENDAVKVTGWIHRISSTIANFSFGNYFGAYRSATGKSTDTIKSTSAKLFGGGIYHFHCPNCGQSFDKRVY